MIFFVKVSSSLQDGFDLIKDGADDVAGLANEVSVIASDVIVAGEDTIPIRDAAIEILNEGLCNSMEEGNGNTIQDFDEEAKLVVDLLTQLSDFTRGELTNLKENLVDEKYNIKFLCVRLSYQKKSKTKMNICSEGPFTPFPP